jgi:hypothetical protein
MDHQVVIHHKEVTHQLQEVIPLVLDIPLDQDIQLEQPIHLLLEVIHQRQEVTLRVSIHQLQADILHILILMHLRAIQLILHNLARAILVIHNKLVAIRHKLVAIHHSSLEVTRHNNLGVIHHNSLEVTHHSSLEAIHLSNQGQATHHNSPVLLQVLVVLHLVLLSKQFSVRVQ